LVNVSIIITSYNKGNFIKDAILSVLYQTHTDWELLIVDDCSTDNTINVISSYLTDNRIKLIKNDVNKGANYCRNIGLKTAQGTYVVFLDADDVLTSLCLGKRMEAVSLSPGADLYVFSMGVFVKNIGDDNRKWIPKSQNPLKDFLQHKLPWGVTQPLWNVNFLKSIGGFNEQMHRLQDVELHTRALMQSNIKYFLYPTITDCYYRIDEERKTYKEYAFMKCLTDSAVMYCNEFEKQVNKYMVKYLYGTVFQISLSLIQNFKRRNINRSEYGELQQLLLSSTLYSRSGVFKKIIFKTALFYNLYLIRVPGINKIISMIVVL
jgi:glycosyltransferase involved in cell wall biosynthesis